MQTEQKLSKEDKGEYKVHKFEEAYGTILVHELISGNERTRQPVVIVPGWSEDFLQTKGFAEELVRSGGDTVSSVEFPRVSIEERPDLPEEQIKANLLYKALQNLGYRKINAITHSEGAISTSLLALQVPELFQSIIYTGPAGIVGEDNAAPLAVRFLSYTVERAKQSRESLLSLIRYAIQDPAQSIREANEIATFSLKEALKQIHTDGIKTFLVHGVDDGVFPMDRVQSQMLTGLFDGVYSVKGKHALPFENYELYLPIFEQIFYKVDKISS